MPQHQSQSKCWGFLVETATDSKIALSRSLGPVATVSRLSTIANVEQPTHFLDPCFRGSPRIEYHYSVTEFGQNPHDVLSPDLAHNEAATTSQAIAITYHEYHT